MEQTRSWYAPILMDEVQYYYVRLGPSLHGLAMLHSQGRSTPSHSAVEHWIPWMEDLRLRNFHESHKSHAMPFHFLVCMFVTL